MLFGSQLACLVLAAGYWQLGVQLLYVSNSFLDALVLVVCGSRGRPQQEKREALLGTPGRR